MNFQVEFNVPRKEIYDAFVNPFKVSQYTRSPAKFNNDEFEMLDGSIQGKFLQQKPSEYIKMLWKFRDWKEFSTVELIFQDPEEDECTLVFNQSNLPKDMTAEKMEQGWRNQIIKPLSQILGFPLK